MNRFKHFCGRVISGAMLLAGVSIWAYLAVAIGAGGNMPIIVRMYLMLGLFFGVFVTSAAPIAKFFDPNWPKGYYDD